MLKHRVACLWMGVALSLASPFCRGSNPLLAPFSDCASDLSLGIETETLVPDALPLSEANLRCVLRADNFADDEIEGIFGVALQMTRYAGGKRLEFQSHGPRKVSESRYYLRPIEIARYWPFFALVDPNIEYSNTLMHAVTFAATVNCEVVVPFARWARFLPWQIRRAENFAVRRFVIQMLQRAPEVAPLVADKMASAFAFRPEELSDAFKGFSDPLQALTFPTSKSRPVNFAASISAHWFTPGSYWPDVVDDVESVRLVPHFSYYCGDCEQMGIKHNQTLLRSDLKSYGRTALIRWRGKIVGAIKGRGDQSFLALRNLYSPKNATYLLLAGGGYQPSPELVASVNRALGGNSFFPVIDVSEMVLKPLSFVDRPDRSLWVHSIQINLDRILSCIQDDGRCSHAVTKGEQ